MTAPVASSRLRQATARLVASLEGPAGLPLGWTLRRYRPEWLGGDVTAGLALAALIVPLSIGYAGVAGLPPEMGLYASIAPLLAYAVLGSSRPLVIGPDAASASMIAASIAPLAASPDDRVRLAGVLGLLVAATFVAMRLAKLGFLADLLSRPILVGYLSGVGITVALGQIPKIIGGQAFDAALGVLRRVDWATADLGAVAAATRDAIRGSGADWVSLAVGGSVLAAMLIGRRAFPRVPMALVVMVASIAVSWALSLQSHSVKVLGPVPGGLPPVGIPTASVPELLTLLPGAIGLALLTFADTAATGKTFAAKVGERTDANRELAALALADAAGSVTGGYAVSSSASRTNATLLAGGKTQLAGIVAAAAVMIVMLLLTAPLSYLPTPALGAVVLVSALGIVDLGAMRSIWRLKPSEGAIALVAMAGVILYGTLVGVVVAVLLAALNIVRRAAAPPIVEVGRLDDGTWRDLRRWGDARRVDGVAVVRFAGPLFFASVTGLDASVRSLVVERPDVVAVVLDMSATSDLDITAAEALRQLAGDLARDGRQLLAARPLGHVRDAIVRYDLGDLLVPSPEAAGTVDGAIAGLSLETPALLAAQEDAVSIAAPAAAAGPRLPAGVAAPPAGGSTAPAGSTDARPPAPGGPGPGRDGDRLVLRAIAAAAGAVVAAAALSVILGLVATGPGTEPGPVPNLVGMSVTRASVAASDAGFVLAQPVLVPRDDLPEGTVVGQSPTAGTVVDRGTAILPMVSTARPLVLVPNAVGQAEAQAIVTLTSAGFGVSRTATVSDAAVPSGVVVSTDPAAGKLLATGTVVGYVVSSGPPPEPTSGVAPTPEASQAPSESVGPGPSPSSSPPLASELPSEAPSAGVPTPSASAELPGTPSPVPAGTGPMPAPSGSATPSSAGP